jgi:lysophospholipase L1-like esterase
MREYPAQSCSKIAWASTRLRDLTATPLVSLWVESVVVMIGINDIAWPGGVLSPTDPPVSIEDLIMGYRQLIAQAHVHNIRIIGVTLTPFEDTFKSVNPPLDYFYNPEKEKTREAVNQWIRESKELDGVIDFDALTRDPQRPSHIQAAFDSGDTISIPTTPVTRRWPIRLTSGY